VSREWANWWKRQGERELSLILWAAWNPVASGVPTDEFDSYASQVGRLLRERAQVEAIERYLKDIRESMLGDHGPWDADAETAELLSVWYEETWPPNA
jgi:hypothetical protein